MTTDLIPTLTTLLDRWTALAQEAAHNVTSAPNPTQGAYFAGVMFGMDAACDELAAALASAMKEAAMGH